MFKFAFLVLLFSLSIDETHCDAITQICVPKPTPIPAGPYCSDILDEECFDYALNKYVIAYENQKTESCRQIDKVEKRRDQQLSNCHTAYLQCLNNGGDPQLCLDTFNVCADIADTILYNKYDRICSHFNDVVDYLAGIFYSDVNICCSSSVDGPVSCDPEVDLCTTQPTPYPAGPYCPPDRPVLDNACVQAAKNKFNLLYQQERNQACLDARKVEREFQRALLACYDNYQNCLSSGRVSAQCKADFQSCTDNAANKRDSEYDLICQSFNNTVESLNSMFYTDIDKCCKAEK
jgi:hypothetical protein